jgi:2-polyprenyl-6-methoxyphenol hydroxylase-like FAD-dependent oxidoreductase
MNSGIQDALQLADMLADVLAGRAKEAALNAYEAERRPVAERVIGITRHLKGIATMRGRAGPKLRNRALSVFSRVPAIVQHFAGQIAGIDRPRQRPHRGMQENKAVYVATLVVLALLVLFVSTR